MRIPSKILCVRHGQSTLNSWHEQLHSDPVYKQFAAEYERDPESTHSFFLAQRLKDKYGSFVADHKSELTFLGRKQARGTAYALRSREPLPDIIYVSPYKRTLQTLEQMQKVWPELRNVPVVRDLNIREQEIGDVALYGDFDLYFAINPEQGRLRNMQDLYYYRFPGGESVPDVQQRLELWLNSIPSQFAGKRVLVVSHFGTILSFRSLLEQWDDERFLKEHNAAAKINCAVTRCENRYGKLEVVSFNKKLW